MSEEKDIPEESHEQDDVNENNSETAAEPQIKSQKILAKNLIELIRKEYHLN